MEKTCVICEDEIAFLVQFEWPSVIKALIFGVYSFDSRVERLVISESHKGKPDEANKFR